MIVRADLCPQINAWGLHDHGHPIWTPISVWNLKHLMSRWAPRPHHTSARISSTWATGSRSLRTFSSRTNGQESDEDLYLWFFEGDSEYLEVDHYNNTVNPWLINPDWLIVGVPPNNFNSTWLLKWYLAQINRLGCINQGLTIVCGDMWCNDDIWQCNLLWFGNLQIMIYIYKITQGWTCWPIKWRVNRVDHARFRLWESPP